ncbi:MAG: ABC transporter ATP-binding protein/permease, partial [Chthoniobacterales bacterium]|nr:ABC transporter ATP-binding protein/permease [Chthoniobacterales bacterium]
MKEKGNKECDNKKGKVGWSELMRLGVEPYRCLLRYLRPYRRRFVLGLMCGLGFAVVNGLFPVVVLVVGRQVFGGSGEQFRLPGGVGRLLEQLPLFQSPSQAGFAGVMMAVVVVPMVMLMRSIFSYLNSYLMAWVSYRMLQDLRLELFSHLLRQGMDFFGRVKAGSLISRVTNDVRVAQTAFVTIASDVFKNPFSILIGAVVLFALDWKFCLVTLLLFPTCLVPVIVFGRKVRKAGKAEEEEAGTMSVILQESFLGIRVIQSFCREEYQERQFARSCEEQFRNSMRVRRATDIVQPLIETVSAFGVALALLYVYFNKMAPERLLALMSGIFLLYDPAKKLSRLHMQLQKAIAASVNVLELLRREPSVGDRSDAIALSRCEGRIEFREVTFDYGTKVAALANFSLVIEPGKKYALVGPSGAGKTTVLSLLQRFYDPKEGEILLDGVDLRRLKLRWLREHIGVVSQETFLFHDTILENVRFGRLD